MSFKVEKTENKNEVKIEITVASKEFEEAMKEVFKENAKYFNIPGFRKGKAPYDRVEKVYGANIFYEDAFNKVATPAYEEAIKSEKLDVVSRPQIDIQQIEKGKDLIFTAVVNTKPEVKLGKYKGVAVEQMEMTVSDEDVEAELKLVAERNSREVSITDSAAEMGNIANINYVGKVDGVEFEGGKADNYNLTLGSNTFIPGFEDQVVGMKIGETKDITVKFPDDYHAADMAGKEAVFTVTLNELKKKELPTIDDEFAKDVSEFDTLADYKADIKTKKEEQNAETMKAQLEDSVIKAVADISEVEIPEGMIELELDNVVENTNRNFQYQYGIKLEQYLKMMGKTEADFRNESRENTVEGLKQRLVLEAVAKDAKLEVEDKEVEDRINELATSYGRKAEELKENEELVDSVKSSLVNEKAIELLVANAKVTKVAKKAEKAEKKTTKKASEEKTEKTTEKKTTKKTTKK